MPTAVLPIGQRVSPVSVIGPAIASGIAKSVGRRKVDRDRRRWIEDTLVIRNKLRQTVPLRFNEPQEILWADWQTQEFRGIREIELKARQLGISTLCLAALFEEAVHVPNTSVAIVSKDSDEVHRKLRTMKLFWQHLPDHEKPNLKYDSKNEMLFADLNSTIYVGKAGNRNFGRGDTLHGVLASEIAFWPDPETLLTGLSEAVPEGEGMLFIESTANGAGTYFQQLYTDARDGKSSYAAKFLPWTILSEYTVPAAQGDPPIERTAEETHLSDGQVRWRRSKKSALLDKFPQEYPETDEEAFLHSGRVRFDTVALVEIAKHCVDPIRIEGAAGELRIYADPVPERQYAIGADTAEGGPDGDFDSAHVVDDETGVEVAVLHGQWPTDVYADKLAAIGRRYNNALIGVERNNTGHAVLQRLLIGEQRYPGGRVYLHLSYDQTLGKSVGKPGWPTTTVTKPVMESGLEALIRDSPQVFRDKATVTELLSIIYRKDLSVGAPAGGFDDRFISRGIAEQIRVASARARSGAPTIAGVVRNRPKGQNADETYRDPRGE